MDPRLQRRVQRYGWDKARPHYEEGWKRQLRPAQDLLLEMADLQPGERVLETACGTGLVTVRAAAAVTPGGHVTATDLSDAMVEACRARASADGLENVDVRRMDAEELEFEDASFDAALCALGLMYVPDPIRSMGEMRRVLAPNGRAVVAVWGERRNCGWAEVFPIVDRRVNSEVCPLFFQLGAPGALAAALSTAGFEEVEEQRIRATLKYESAEEALAATYRAGPVALAYARFDDETRNGAHEEYLASIEPYRMNGGYEIPGEFVVARGDLA